VWQAVRGGTSYAQLAGQLDGIDSLLIDIDTVEVFPMTGGPPLALDEHPRVRAAVELLDGEVLDELNRLWHRGKGKPDPETCTSETETTILEGWQPGGKLAWGELFPEKRSDHYVLGEDLFEATEIYCPVPGCDCGEVRVVFDQSVKRGFKH